MYTGTLIDDLLNVVERVEEHVAQQSDQHNLEYWYALAQAELVSFEPSLAGVA